MRTAAIWVGGGLFLPFFLTAQAPETAQESVGIVTSVGPAENTSADSTAFMAAQNRKNIEDNIARRADICAKLRRFIDKPTEENRAIVNSVAGINLKNVNADSFDFRDGGVIQAYYDLMTGIVNLNYIIFTSLSSKEDSGLNIEKMNANLIRAFLHEDDHREKDRSISRLGLTISEIFEYHVHKEVSARARELLNFRQELLGGVPIKKALSMDTYQMFKRTKAGGYLDYLKQHEKDLPEAIGPEEMDLVLNTALDMLQGEGTRNSYPGNTKKQVSRDMLLTQPIYTRATNGRGGAESYIAERIEKYPSLSEYFSSPTDYDEMLSRVYTFDGVCFYVGLKDQDAFLNKARALCDDYGMGKFVTEMEKQGPTYDEQARAYLHSFITKNLAAANGGKQGKEIPAESDAALNPAVKAGIEMLTQNNK